MKRWIYAKSEGTFVHTSRGGCFYITHILRALPDIMDRDEYESLPIRRIAMHIETIASGN